MADSIDVLSTLKLVYTIYALIAISLIGWFALKVSQPGKTDGVKATVFWSYVAVLVVVGTGMHFLTYNVVPWVPTDLNRANIAADQIHEIHYKDHQILLDQTPIQIECGKKIVFNATSDDLTYGFGIFRQNNTMVAQMQVVPGSRNDLMWEFHKNGTYHIRSTEYSGPKGAHMVLEDAIVVSGCDQDDPHSLK